MAAQKTAAQTTACHRLPVRLACFRTVRSVRINGDFTVPFYRTDAVLVPELRPARRELGIISPKEYD
jgi:hypothetical protein